MLLKVDHYGRLFWFLYLPMIVAIFFIEFFYHIIASFIGVNPGIVWFGLLVIAFVFFTFGQWNQATLIVVEQDQQASTTP